MNLSRCKQVTVADVVSGWHFSGPLADCIRRKNGSPVAIAQSGEDVPSFGISTEPWARLRWGGRWARKVVRGWSGKAVAKWFAAKKLQDQLQKDAVDFGVCDWWTSQIP